MRASQSRKSLWHHGSWVILGSLLLAGSACRHGLGSAAEAGTAEVGRSPVQLNVVNRFNGPIEVHALGSGTTYRMGTVLPGQTSRFLLRPIMIASGPVEFVVYTGNGRPPVRSDRLLLGPGQIVDFDVASSLMNSSATIRR